MRILVTGASGFLGSRLCRELELRGNELQRLDSKNCNLREPDSLKQFDHSRYDQIYHLAAWTQAGDFCLQHSGEQWVVNQLINTHVLQWWQVSQPQARLISMGTSCSYSPDLPLSEEHYLDGNPIESLFAYAHTKRMLLIGQMALQKQYGLKWLTLVPSTLYGPGYHTDGRQMHFIFDLIRKILRGKLYGEIPVLWGDGSQKRELVYLEDFVRAALDLTPSSVNEIVNIGAGEEHSIRDFARIICEIVDYDFDLIGFDASKYVGAKSKVLDVTRMNRLLPNHPRTPLREGLSKTVAWFLENRPASLEGYIKRK